MRAQDTRQAGLLKGSHENDHDQRLREVSNACSNRTEGTLRTNERSSVPCQLKNTGAHGNVGRSCLHKPQDKLLL